MTLIDATLIFQIPWISWIQWNFHSIGKNSIDLSLSVFFSGFVFSVFIFHHVSFSLGIALSLPHSISPDWTTLLMMSVLSVLCLLKQHTWALTLFYMSVCPSICLFIFVQTIKMVLLVYWIPHQHTKHHETIWTMINWLKYNIELKQVF